MANFITSKIPNTLTCGNLISGCIATLFALCGEAQLALVWIIAGAVFDFFDGFVARLLGQSSPIGLQLDSLSDDISFGLLPASILYVLYGRMPSLWLGEGPAAAAAAYAVFVVAAFAALRLAKFNIDDTQRTEFCGLPSPAAALLCGSLGLLAERNGLVLPREAVLAVAAAAAWLMVSGIRMFALKFHGFGWRGNELRYSFLAAGAAMIVLLRGYAVPLVIALYVVVSFVRGLACRTNQ